MEARRNRKYECHVTSKEIEFIIKNFSMKKTPGSNVFTGEIYQTFK